MIVDSPRLAPLPHQTAPLRAVRSSRRRGASRGLVVMATGTGKTVVAAHAAREFLADHPGERVLYLCHQKDILAQARETFAEVLGPDTSHGFFHGGEKNLHEVDCLYASFQAMATWREAFHRDEFGLVVVDESHHGHAPTYRPTIEHFTPRYLLGMTATPDRADLQDIRQIYGPEIHSLPIENALAGGLLTPVDYRLLTDEIQEIGTVLSTNRGRVSVRELDRALFAPKRDEEVVRLVAERTAAVDRPKTLVFCGNIPHAERMAAAFPHALALHSRLTPAEQDQRLRLFRSGRLPTLVTVDKLNEGFDVPDANVVVFLRSTASRTVFLQQLGRGLRRLPGKDSVLVLDLVGNCERLAMVQDLWQRVRENSPANGEAGDERQAIAVNIGSVEFTETARRILDVLAEVRGGYRREVLIAKLQALAADLGATPTTAQVVADPQMPSVSAYQSMFGSWTKAVLAAGLTPLKAAPVGADFGTLSPAGRELIRVVQERYATDGRGTSWSATLVRAIRLCLSGDADDPRSRLTIAGLDLAALRPHPDAGLTPRQAAEVLRQVQSAARVYAWTHPGRLGSAVGGGLPEMRMPTRGRRDVTAAGKKLLAAVAETADGRTSLQTKRMTAAVHRVLYLPVNAPDAGADVTQLDPEAALDAANWEGVSAKRRYAVSQEFRAAIAVYDRLHPGQLGAEVPHRLVLAPAGRALIDTLAAELAGGRLQPRLARNLRTAVEHFLRVPANSALATVDLAGLDIDALTEAIPRRGPSEGAGGTASARGLLRQAALLHDATRPDLLGRGSLGIELSPDARAWLVRRVVRLEGLARAVGGALPGRVVLPPAGWDLLRQLATEFADGRIDRVQAGYLGLAVLTFLGAPAGTRAAELTVGELDVEAIISATSFSGTTHETAKAKRGDFRAVTRVLDRAYPGVLGAAVPAPPSQPDVAVPQEPSRVLAPAGRALLAVVEELRSDGELDMRAANALRRSVRGYLEVEAEHPLAEVDIALLDLRAVVAGRVFPQLGSDSILRYRTGLYAMAELYEARRGERIGAGLPPEQADWRSSMPRGGRPRSAVSRVRATGATAPPPPARAPTADRAATR